jgi:hypothetical protein
MTDRVQMTFPQETQAEINMPTQSDHMSDADITRQIKSVLKNAFPKCKFSVSSRSGIEVRWTDDGPNREQVEDVLLNAGCAQTWEDFQGVKHLRGFDRHLWLDCYNAAKRAAEKEEQEQWYQERLAQNERADEAVKLARQAREKAAGNFPLSEPAQSATDPAVYRALDDLRQKAETDVSLDSDVEQHQRRPTWAPPLIIEGELLEICRELGHLSPDDKPVARLWATFADPRASRRHLREHVSKHSLPGIECRTLQLHPGNDRQSVDAVLFEAQRTDSGWQLGPKLRFWAPREKTWQWEHDIRERLREQESLARVIADSPEGLRLQERISDLSKKITARDAEVLAKEQARRRRHSLRLRAIELAGARVLTFAGAPNLQMQLAGRLIGRCCICGYELTDPISLERGIGPECIRHRIAAIWDYADHECSKEEIALSTGMSIDFVSKVLNEPRPRPPAPPPDPNDPDAIVLIIHSAVFGDLKTVVREFKVSDVRPYAQHEVSVNISFLERRERKWKYVTVTPGSERYHTIELNGLVFYDSRKDVPCDMAEWEKTRKRFEDHPAMTANRAVP